MDLDASKLRFQEQHQAAEQQRTGSQPAALEFATAEELLRHDAAQVTPPPSLRRRLVQSLRGEKSPRRRWWQRFFSRDRTGP